MSPPLDDLIQEFFWSTIILPYCSFPFKESPIGIAFETRDFGHPGRFGENAESRFS